MGGKPEGKLYKAPFFNIANGSVCLGNSNINIQENPTFENIIEYWEKRMWLSEFTHLGGSNNPTKNNLVTVTKKSKRKFDCEELIKMIITLKSLLK